jgi:hypothetical protein
MRHAVTICIALALSVAACARSRPRLVSTDSQPERPSLCEAAAAAGFRCSAEGHPVLDGPYPPRLELVTACEAAARVHAPCSNPYGHVLLVEY